MPEVKKIAEELRDKLKEYEDFEGLYLYGSQAKETAAPESDIDIAGIFKYNHNYDLDLNSKIYDLELEYDVLIDFHSVTPDELRKNYIYQNEIKKGIYYAR